MGTPRERTNQPSQWLGRERKYLMHKKILGICAALVALAAFAIAPAMAAASPHLTEGGTPVAVGSKITATGLNSSEFSSGFINVSCNDYWMTAEVKKNN